MLEIESFRQSMNISWEPVLRYRIYLAIQLILSFGILTSNVHGLPKYGFSELKSPHGEYTLKLVDTSDRWTYELKLLRNNVELAHYAFEGELVSAYWNPSLHFVAINNNNAHGGIYVWIISLSDGSIITSHGIIHASDYDRYSDYHYFVDLPRIANAKLAQVYPEVDKDQLREGYTTVAYGWTHGNQILMFHELPFENLYSKEKMIIQAYTTSQVIDQAITLKEIAFKKVRNQPREPMPREVKKTLNFMD